MAISIKELSEELQDIKVQIGVKKEIIKNKREELAEYDLSSEKKAEAVLEKIDEQLKEISNRLKKLKAKAKRILDKVG